jgi:hypothetical protein
VRGYSREGIQKMKIGFRLRGMIWLGCFSRTGSYCVGYRKHVNIMGHREVKLKVRIISIRYLRF